MKQKLLTISLALVIGIMPFLGIWTTPTYAECNAHGYYDGSGDCARDMQTELNESQRDYNVLKAYSDYESNANDGNREKLNNALRIAHGNDTGDLLIIAKDQEAAAARTAINSQQDNPINIPDNDDALKSTLKEEKAGIDRQTAELEVVLGDKSSNTIATDHEGKDTAEIAGSVRQLQDLDRMQKLGCISKYPSTTPQDKRENDSKPSRLCDNLIAQYNARCTTANIPEAGSTETSTNKCTPIVGAPPILRDRFQASRKTASERVQQVEQVMQDAMKTEMQGQKLEVTKILRYRTREAESLTYDDIIDQLKATPSGTREQDAARKAKEKEIFLQENYAEYGIVYFISRIVDSLVLAVGSLAVVALIIGGYLLMFSGADEQKRESGKEVVKYTIIGLILVFSSYAIISFIMGLFFTQ